MPQSNALVDDTGKSFFSQSSIVMHALTLPSQLRCFDSCRVDIVAADCAVYAIPFAVAITSSLINVSRSHGLTCTNSCKDECSTRDLDHRNLLREYVDFSNAGPSPSTGKLELLAFCLNR